MEKRFEIVRDEAAENPMDCMDFLFAFILDGGRYFSIKSEGAFVPVDENGEALDGLFALPVYAYVHSGIALSLGSFSDPWDSGRAGWVYVEKARFCKEAGIAVFDEERARKWAAEEVRIMSDYLAGECYGWREIEKCPHCGEWKEVDSCYGYYGFQDAEEGAREAGAKDGEIKVA